MLFPTISTRLQAVEAGFQYSGWAMGWDDSPGLPDYVRRFFLTIGRDPAEVVELGRFAENDAIDSLFVQLPERERYIFRWFVLGRCTLLLASVLRIDDEMTREALDGYRVALRAIPFGPPRVAAIMRQIKHCSEVDLKEKAVILHKVWDELKYEAAQADDRNLGTTISTERLTIMRDQFNADQVGAMGPGAHAHDMIFNKMWQQAEGTVNLPLLSQELPTLRSGLLTEATEPDHYMAVASVAAAERAATEGDGPKTLEHLKAAGQWALDVASRIGTTVAVDALKKSLGLP